MIRMLSSLVKCITLLYLLAPILAAPQLYPQRITVGPVVNEVPSPYQYEYKVENAPSNTYFGKNEIGDANGRVTGSYYVYLPDGRLMTVDYIADRELGFVPKITFASPSAYPGGVIRG